MEGATRSRSRAPRSLLPAAVLVWLLIVCGSFVLLWKYKSTPGVAGTRVDWPVSSRLARASDRPTLVMFAHPYCPCTRASMSQLGEIVARTKGAARTLVVFAGVEDDDPTKSALWMRAASLQGVTPVLDRDGAEAAAFGARTSGTVVVFDRDGRSVFRGGITAARGHEGENPGAARVLAVIETGTANRAESPVFGCSLTDE